MAHHVSVSRSLYAYRCDGTFYVEGTMRTVRCTVVSGPVRPPPHPGTIAPTWLIKMPPGWERIYLAYPMATRHYCPRCSAELL